MIIRSAELRPRVLRTTGWQWVTALTKRGRGRRQSFGTLTVLNVDDECVTINFFVSLCGSNEIPFSVTAISDQLLTFERVKLDTEISLQLSTPRSVCDFEQETAWLLHRVIQHLMDTLPTYLNARTVYCFTQKLSLHFARALSKHLKGAPHKSCSLFPFWEAIPKHAHQ